MIPKTVHAVIRDLEVIGEAAKNIPQELKVKYPNIQWRGMISMTSSTHRAQQDREI